MTRALSRLATVQTMHRDHVSMLLKMGQLPSEHDEQTALIEYCADPDALAVHPEFSRVYAIPNFSGRMGKRTARHSARLTAEGRRPGYPDLGLDVARGGYHGWRGELKRRDGGTLLEQQAEWLAWLKRQGYYVSLAWGWEAMRDELLAYLAMEDSRTARDRLIAEHEQKIRATNAGSPDTPVHGARGNAR